MKKGDKKEYTEEELKRHVGAMAEKYQDDVKVTREGIIGITQILGRIEKTLDSHTEEIGNLMVDITSVKSDVKELRADMIEAKSDLKQIKTEGCIISSTTNF